MSPENVEMFKLVVQPVVDRLDRMEPKLDHLFEIGERVRAVETSSDRSAARLRELEVFASEATKELAHTKGRNTVISWLLTLVGAPIVVGLALAGIAALFNHPGPGDNAHPATAARVTASDPGTLL